MSIALTLTVASLLICKLVCISPSGDDVLSDARIVSIDSATQITISLLQVAGASCYCLVNTDGVERGNDI